MENALRVLALSLLFIAPQVLAECDLISRFSFSDRDDLPVLCDPTGFPADRHVPFPLGTTDAAQGYYEYLPQGYVDDNQDYPLLVFIHGLGENGNGTTDLDDLLVTGIPRLIDDDDWNEDLPFVVLSPQNSSGGCTSSNQIANFIDYAKQNYRININRVYLTGLSCGAIGSWNYLGAYIDSQIAAVVPIAGNGNSAFNNAGCELNRVPIWAFHGDADGTVDVNGTINPINNLLACTDPAPIDTSMVIYPGVGHTSWQQTYDLSEGHDIYEWFLSHRNANIVEPIVLESGSHVAVDVGSAAATTAPPWNNLISIAGGTGNLLDEQSRPTTVQVSITDGFTGTNQNGIPTNTLNIPETVTEDNFWVGSFDGHAAALLESATVSISGLNPAATYDLELFASRSGNDGGNNRLTRYTVGGDVQDLEVSDNTDTSIIFADLTGADTIELTIQVSPNGTTRFAYLGGMRLVRTD